MDAKTVSETEGCIQGHGVDKMAAGTGQAAGNFKSEEMKLREKICKFVFCMALFYFSISVIVVIGSITLLLYIVSKIHRP